MLSAGAGFDKSVALARVMLSLRTLSLILIQTEILLRMILR